MELLAFIFDQFKIPIIGITVFVLLAWIRVIIRPVRRISPEELEQQKNVKDSEEA